VSKTDTAVRTSAPVTSTSSTSASGLPWTSWILSAANLGFGLGIGGIVGILFMLVAGSIFGRRDS
jgi:hypothetical protein